MTELQRPKYLRKKDILLVCDVPVKKELEWDEPFSSASNLNLLTSLRTGRTDPFNTLELDNHTGINSMDVHTTYLDYSYYGEDDVEDNFDFKSEFKKKKDLHLLTVRYGTEEYFVEKDVETVTQKSIAKHSYYKLETHKDLYISYRLKAQVDCLVNEIREVEPKIIIVVGKWSLFFLSGLLTLAQTQGNYKDRKPLGGLTTYRASIMGLHESLELPETLLYPMFHSISAMTMPDKLSTMDLDLQKIAYIYGIVKEKGVEYYRQDLKEYIVGTNKEELLLYIKALLARLDTTPRTVSCDIETMYHSMIDCIGITDNSSDGLCIPFASRDTPSLWSAEDEVELMWELNKVLTHPNCKLLFQNGSYDITYIRDIWGIQLEAPYDTLVMHHTLYNYLPKDLAFLASRYADKYCYWKNESSATKEAPETRWVYNIKDIIYTLEVKEVLYPMLQEDKELLELYTFQQEKLAPILAGMMNKGIRVDVPRKKELYTFFSKLLLDIVEQVKQVLGEDFNPNSSPQKKKIFSDLLGIELVKRKGTDTCDASAMLEYLKEYPMYKPLLSLLLEHSSLKVFTNNFLGMELDKDGRARTQYKIAGTATGRLASTKNVYGRGANLMNIPSKGKLDLQQCVALVDHDSTLAGELEIEGLIKLPNIKKIFLPDEGMEFCDADYSGADIMVVAADSDCTWLQDYFSNPRGCGKVYAYIASNYFQREVLPTDKEYKIYKGVFNGSNYGMGVAKLASMAGISQSLAQGLQDYYFDLCWEVRKWQQRIARDIKTKGFISNIYGRRGWYVNNNDPMLLNKALAFIPQSTIADLINHAMVEIDRRLPNATITLQVHDSLVVQYPTEKAEYYRQHIINCMEIPLPYTPKLVIPAGIQVSTKSYGEVS